MCCMQTQQSYDDVVERFNETQNNLQTIESQLEVVTGEVHWRRLKGLFMYLVLLLV